MPMDIKMDKQFHVYKMQYCYTNKKEQITATTNNMGETHTSIRLNKWSYAQRSSDSIYIIQVIQNDYGMTPFIWHSKVAHTELKLKGNDLWWKKVKDFVLLAIWMKATWLCNWDLHIQLYLLLTYIMSVSYLKYVIRQM